MAEAIGELAELLDENLSRGRAAALDPLELTRAQISELAELLSGASRRGQPRSYLSARKRVERWRSGENRPSARGSELLERANRQNSQRIADFKQRGADMRLTIRFYAGRRAESLPKGHWQHIQRTVTLDVIRAWARPDYEYAAELLLRAFLANYGVPNPSDWLAIIEIVKLDLEPGVSGGRKELWRL